jgi:hypothetical protein
MSPIIPSLLPAGLTQSKIDEVENEIADVLENIDADMNKWVCCTP